MVAMDARMVDASGIGTYIRGLLSHLPEVPGTKDRIVLIGDPTRLHEVQIGDAARLSEVPIGDPARFSEVSIGAGMRTRPGRQKAKVSEEPFGTRMRTSDPPYSMVTAASRIYSAREQWEIPRAFGRTRARLLFVPHYNVPVSAVARSVVTIHDLIHLKFPQFLPSKGALLYANLFLRHVVPRARAILTVSEHSRRDLVETLGLPESRITVTPLGFAPQFRPRDPEEIAEALSRLGLAAGYLLYVGNLKEFKNVPLLVRAYRELRQKSDGLPPLVLVGRNSIAGFEEVIREAGGVRWLPEVRREDLPLVYGGAMALVFPSLYEGFGLPPLEAMACGTPVICSNRASLPEVVGDAALLIDPLSLEDLQAAMVRVAGDAGLRQALREAGLARSRRFTWRRTAEQTWEVLTRAAGSRR